MKKDLKKIKAVALGATGLVAAIVCAMAFDKDVSSNTNESIRRTYAGARPSAGIALVSNSYLTDGGKDSDETTGGIASVLRLYYEGNNEEDASVKPVDKVISLIPQSQEDRTEETQAEEQAKEEPKPEENKPITSVVSEYTVLGVANVTNYLNVREEPKLDGKLLGKLPMNAGCEILENADGWYKVRSGNVEGYVSAEYLLTGEEANKRAEEVLATVAKVNADMLMVRSEPNTDCEILTRVAQNEELEVAEQLSGWVKVNIDSIQGYVCADYVDVYKTLPKGVTLKELSYGDGVSNTAVDLIEYAKQFLGNPYVYGGTSLTNGTDCSGFTMRVFQHFGYSLSRTSRQQAHNGTNIPVSEIRPGDLLFYRHGSQIGHVAIYIGNGQIIHASTERTGIIIGNAYYTTPACATRIIN